MFTTWKVNSTHIRATFYNINIENITSLIQFLCKQGGRIVSLVIWQQLLVPRLQNCSTHPNPDNYPQSPI